MKKFLVLVSALFLAACSTFHIKPETREVEPLPVEFSMYGEREVAPDKWWESFGSDELNKLIEASLSQNLSIKQAVARLKQAEAVSIQAGSSGRLNSEIDASASGGKEGINDKSFNRENYSAGIGVSYELDLWGKIEGNVKSAEFNEAATAEDLYTVRMTTAAEVALRWFELAEVHQIITLLEEQVQTNKKILGLIELRFKRSQATALDVLQQRDVVAQAESLIPNEKARQKTVLHQLAILLGKVPGSDLNLKVEKLPIPPTVPHTGVPADLLAKRPDIRSAGFKLQAADWTIAAAKADRLPSLKLTGSARYNSTEFDDVFDNWLANLAGSLTLPIIDGGFRKAEVERTKAIAEERVNAYRETVLTALKEVEDALVQEMHQDEFLLSLQKRLQLSKSTKQEAGARYRKGLETYLPVLTAILSEQSLERTILTAELTKLRYRVLLHRALGGDWMTEKEKENE